MNGPRDTDRERRKIFRQLSWVFVYLPPILAILIGAGGAALLAFLFPFSGTSFWQRWLIGVLLILVLPTIGYLVWNRMRGE